MIDFRKFKWVEPELIMLKKEIYDRLLLGFEQFKRAEVSESTRIVLIIAVLLKLILLL